MIAPRQTISVRASAQFIHAGLDPQGLPCVWAKVNTKDVDIFRDIILCGTGTDLLQHGEHIGTFNQGLFVWHVFTT